MNFTFYRYFQQAVNRWIIWNIGYNSYLISWLHVDVISTLVPMFMHEFLAKRNQACNIRSNKLSYVLTEYL